MALRVRGYALVLGDEVDTDTIIPSTYLHITSPERLAEGVFAKAPELRRRLDGLPRPVVIVAGRGFGYGSSREHAPRLLKLAGIGAVVAKSFHRIFYRNSINIGLPVIVARRIPDVTQQGDTIVVDMENGVVRNETRGVEERFQPPPPVLLEILRSGGIVEYIKKTGRLPW